MSVACEDYMRQQMAVSAGTVPKGRSQQKSEGPWQVIKKGTRVDEMSIKVSRMGVQQAASVVTAAQAAGKACRLIKARRGE